MRPTSRWDLLLESKPIPLIDHLLEEVAKLLAKDLSGWPPPIEEIDLTTGAGFEELLAPDFPRPRPEAFTEAFRLARWELERETEAYDEYMRNKRWLERGLAPNDKRALLFISRWLVEQMLALGEATTSRMKRAHMLKCLESAERRLTATPLQQ
jgi:hypothetical protein